MRRRGFLTASLVVLLVGIALALFIMKPSVCHMDEECSPNEARVWVAAVSLLLSGILAALSFPGRPTGSPPSRPS